MTPRLAIAAFLFLLLPLRGRDTLPTNALTPEQQKALDMRLPELNRAALEPEERVPEKVADGERNPFGILSVPKQEEEKPELKEETEEMKIRRVLANMRVAGLFGSPGSYEVLLGGFLLRVGQDVPRLFYDQAERLVVDDITERQITLRFVERDRSAADSRKLAIYYDMNPRVRSFLVGELWNMVVKFDDQGKMAFQPVPTSSAAGILKAFENQQLREALTDSPRELLGESWPSQTNETSDAPR
jgi:hypothetical protein